VTAVLERPTRERRKPQPRLCENPKCRAELPITKRAHARFCKDRCRVDAAQAAARRADLAGAAQLAPDAPTRRAPRRAPAPSVVWHVAVVNRRATAGAPGRHLSGQRVVIVAAGRTDNAPMVTIMGRAATGPAAGRIVRETLLASALTLLPAAYRVRPCMDPCGADGTCHVLTRPGEPDDHRDSLDGALIAATAHAAGQAA
jgi:hypothetical protein